MLPIGRCNRYTVLLANSIIDVSEVPMDLKADSAFLRKFGGVIAGFIVLTIVLIFVARYMQPEPDIDDNPSQGILAEQRIAPVGAVRSGERGAAALAEEQSAVAEATPAGEIVVDGAQVYGGLCKACHDAGVAGAPISGSELMGERVAAKGLEGVVQSAIDGLNAMPPKGGNPSLSDEQIQAAVEYMLP
jgi:cytochrome c5